ncbi:MAG: Sensor protein SrrB [bacterium ADurb.Bin429]|nr:MAG: Sensor protein SrrB [bacterium ADurb.Bin429]
MPRTRLSLIVRLVFLLIPVIIIGLSALLFVIEARHRQILEDELHAIRTLQRVDQATILLDRQRLRVAQSVYLPLDPAAIGAGAAEFRAQFADPEMFPRVESRALQRQILAEYDTFVAMTLALPADPTVGQVQNVQRQAEAVVSRLDALGALHTADLEEIFRSEREQSQVSDLVLLITNLSVLTLVIIGFVLLTRLGRQQTEAAALRATDQLRNEFVAFAAHELRNPASAIKTGAALLREPDVEPEIQTEIVESINRSADALSRLVLTLLTMGRLEEGRLQLTYQRVWLSALLGDLVAELEVYHPGVEGRIHRALPKVQVQVDPEYSKLAFSNILDNALKYAPPRTPITVTGEEQEGEVLVRIHNSGPVISPDVLPHIFDKYETTGTAPQSTRQGVGLGLYMTRLLIEAHGGRVWAESAPETGTTITVTLPVAR